MPSKVVKRTCQVCQVRKNVKTIWWLTDKDQNGTTVCTACVPKWRAEQKRLGNLEQTS